MKEYVKKIVKNINYDEEREAPSFERIREEAEEKERVKEQINEIRNTFDRIGKG